MFFAYEKITKTLKKAILCIPRKQETAWSCFNGFLSRYLQEFRELHQNSRYDSFSFGLFRAGLRDLDCFYWPPQKNTERHFIQKKKICFCFKIKGLSLRYEKLLQKRILFQVKLTLKTILYGQKHINWCPSQFFYFWPE